MLWTGLILEREVVSSCGVHADVPMDMPMDVLMGVPMGVGRPDAPGSRLTIRACVEMGCVMSTLYMNSTRRECECMMRLD